MEVITVTQLNKFISSIFQQEEALQSVFIKGEISNFTNHYKTGHFYFTLKDDKAAVKCVMFRSNAENIPFIPENGMEIIISGEVKVYEARGEYQLYCRDMMPVGKGSYQLAYEQLKEKLEKEGLFDPIHKKPLPETPKTIGVITAEQGAALQDIISVIDRRYPFVKLMVYPAAVQGVNCAGSIKEALQTALGNKNLDLILITRGGGSIEDLWGFNDEELARMVFEADTPIVSAVGHEVDFTILDFAADLRAPTPSAAAELIVPNIAYKKERLQFLKEDAMRHMNTILDDYSVRISTAKNQPFLQRSLYFIEEAQVQLKALQSSLTDKMNRQIEKREETLAQVEKLIGAVSVHTSLQRGFSILFKDKKVIKSIAETEIDDTLTAQLRDGKLQVKVLKKELGETK